MSINYESYSLKTNAINIKLNLVVRVNVIDKVETLTWRNYILTRVKEKGKIDWAFNQKEMGMSSFRK